MSAIYDITINILATALWAAGSYVIGKHLLKKSKSSLRNNFVTINVTSLELFPLKKIHNC
jgi:hypothetical protein